MPASTPRKTTAAKKTAAVRKPAPRAGDTPAAASMNFDNWSRDDAVDPYVIVIGGKRYTSLDPMDLDFRVLDSLLETPDALFRELFPEHAEEILANKIPLGALASFTQGVADHFGLSDFVAAQS